MSLKLKRITAVVAFIAGNLYLTAVSGQNLITNPTFDVDFTGWTGNAFNASSSLVGESAYSSFTSNKLVIFTNSGVPSGNQSLTQNLNISSAGNYRLSFSYGFRSVFNASLRLANTNSANVQLAGNTVARFAITNSGSTNNVNNTATRDTSSLVSYTTVIDGVSANRTLAMTQFGTSYVSGTYSAGWTALSLDTSLQAGSQDLVFSWSYLDTGFVLDNLSLIYLGSSGPSAADTQSSISLSARRLQGIYNLQSAALISGLSYDCQVFDVSNLCLSTGGRYSDNHGAFGNTTSALLIGAYRFNKNVRIGIWVDQNLSTNTGIGVNLGNSKPLFGVFGAWSENPTGEGYAVKASAGYGDKDLIVTRDVIGTSEAGIGNSRLNSQAISTVSSYGFRLNNQLLASPYVGIRYSKITTNGYTEVSSDDVTAPLTHNRLSQENVALMVGLKLSAKLDPKTTLVASAGIEQNLKNRAGQYSATGVDGLIPIEFNSNPQKTRATASLGAYYDIDKTQRVAVNGIYSEETFNPTATTSVLATYTVGF